MTWPKVVPQAYFLPPNLSQHMWPNLSQHMRIQKKRTPPGRWLRPVSTPRPPPHRKVRVGVEIETCARGKIERVGILKPTHDSSIRCHAGLRPVEYIIDYNNKVFMDDLKPLIRDMQLLLPTIHPCADNDLQENSCGMHVHMSLPHTQLDDFPFHLIIYQTLWIQRFQRTNCSRYGSRVQNGYCELSYESKSVEDLDKYSTLNLLPTLQGDRNIHIEFRGMGDAVELFTYKGHLNVAKFTEYLQFLQTFVRTGINLPSTSFDFSSRTAASGDLNMTDMGLTKVAPLVPTILQNVTIETLLLRGNDFPADQCLQLWHAIVSSKRCHYVEWDGHMTPEIIRQMVRFLHTDKWSGSYTPKIFISTGSGRSGSNAMWKREFMQQCANCQIDVRSDAYANGFYIRVRLH